MEITYKQAGEEDIGPVCGLCGKLIRDYERMELIDYPRVMDWERRKLTNSIGEYTVIYVDGQKAGYYHFFRNEDGQYELDDLYVFQEFQNRGIGTEVIRKCCLSANGPVMLYVFIANSRAVSLYERLGFAVTETIKGSRYIMRREKA